MKQRDMMKALGIVSFFLAGMAVAEECEVEHWRLYRTKVNELTGQISIDGTASCHNAELFITLWKGEGEGRSFQGVGQATIYHGTFKTEIDVTGVPVDFRAEFTIDENFWD